MSRYTEYIDLSQIDRIEIYVDKCKHTAKELRQKLGCDRIINGGLYTFSTMQPNCQLKVNGSVLANDGYNYVSFVFNADPSGTAFDVIPTNTAKWKNAIACCCFVRNGVIDTWNLNNVSKNSAIAYSTNRTAIGFKDGKLALYIGTDDMTPKTLTNYLIGLGWSDVIMMDGGGSTQGYLGSGKEITSSRCVHNYICIYMKKGSSESNPVIVPDDVPAEGFVSGKNPYPKPTRAIQYYTTGNDVKWVQYQLNVHGITTDVDGSYGPTSLEHVKKFQRLYNLQIDGSCGPATREALAKTPSEVADDVPVNPYTIGNNPYSAPTTAVVYGNTGNAVRWMQWMLNAHGYPVEIDGSFGPACLSAVREFQADHLLDVDGSCGPATQAALKKQPTT